MPSDSRKTAPQPHGRILFKASSWPWLLKTFAAFVFALGVGTVCLSGILHPEMKERGFVVHMSLDLIQDMLNANLAGKDIDDIALFLSQCHDEFLSNAQIATASDLFSPQAPQKFGIIIRGREQIKILEGEAFWTGKPPGGPPPHKPPRALGSDTRPDGPERGSRPPERRGGPRPPEWRGGPHPPEWHGGPRPPEWHDGPHPPEPEYFTIYSLVHYTADIMSADRRRAMDSMRRASFWVIPIARTPYVVFARMPAPMPPEISHRSIAIGALVMLVILFLTALALSLPLVLRIRRIQEVCQAVSQGDYTARCLDRRADSLGMLAMHIDDMTASIERHLGQQKSLLQAVSHELRTPLSRIRFTVEMLDIDESDPKALERVDSIDEDLTEIDNLIKELGYFNYVDAGKGRQHFESMALRDLIDATLHQRSLSIGDFDVELVGITADMVIEADPTAFKRVIGNLVSNASRYAKKTIRIRAAYSDDRKAIRVSVEDDGPGIPVDMRTRIFEPFVCLEASRSKSMTGCGLGLAIADRIMRVHDGSIEALDSDLGGAQMLTIWPVTHG